MDGDKKVRYSAHSISNLNDRRHDNRFRLEFFLDKSLQMDAQIFFENCLVRDLGGFHFGDRLGYRLPCFGGEAIRRLETGDALKCDLRLARDLVRLLVDRYDE